MYIKTNLPEYKKGFTLAEVLITLVIIGVIAALTIPTLMKNTQKQELITGLKKASSTLSQALMDISRNNDAPAGDYSFMNNVDFVDEFAKVANVLKICNTPNECFSSTLKNTDGKYKYLSGSNANLDTGKSFITADGQLFVYTTQKNVYGLTTEDSDNFIGRIIVDVNGQKNPNTVGRDVFTFYIINGKGIVPAGANSLTDCSSSGMGFTCTSRILRKGKMDY